MSRATASPKKRDGRDPTILGSMEELAVRSVSPDEPDQGALAVHSPMLIGAELAALDVLDELAGRRDQGTINKGEFEAKKIQFLEFWRDKENPKLTDNPNAQWD